MQHCKDPAGCSTYRFDADAISQIVNHVVVVEKDESPDLILVFVSPPYQVGECRRAVQAAEYSLPFLFLVWSVQPEIACRNIFNVTCQSGPLTSRNLLTKVFRWTKEEDVIHRMLAEAVSSGRIVGIVSVLFVTMANF